MAMIFLSGEDRAALGQSFQHSFFQLLVSREGIEPPTY